MKHSRAFGDGYDRKIVQKRYARGGEVDEEPKPDPVGGPQTDSDMVDVENENYPVKLRTRPDAYGEYGREQLKQGK